MSSHEPLNAAYPQTRTLEQAAKLHQIAATNLAYIATKLRCLKPPLDLGCVYLGNAAASCAPAELDLHYVFTHFDYIARGGFVAHPSLPIEINAAIFCYGMDAGHSFSMYLNHSRTTYPSA